MMKRRLRWSTARWWWLALVLAIGAVAVAAAACGDDGPEGGPKFGLAGQTFDLGTIRIGEVVEREVEFTNEGTEPLSVAITKVRPAPSAECGCGVEKYVAEPATVGPGEAGRLLFTLRGPEGMADMQDTMLAEIETNDPGKPLVTIELSFRMTP